MIIKDSRLNWYKIGDSYLAEDIYREAICTELYQKGLNLVPNVFFGYSFPYGKRINERQTIIPIEMYQRINGALKDGICTDFSFKVWLNQMTWTELMAFRKVTNEFAKQVKEDRLTYYQLEKALEAHARVIALAEFNCMLPVSWYKEKLDYFCKDYQKISIWDFSYCQVMPYRVMIRLVKLRGLRYLLKKELKSFDEHVKLYLQHFSQLDYHFPSFPLRRDEDMEKQSFLNEIKEMSEHMDLGEVETELNAIRANRVDSQRGYYSNLSMIGQCMLKAKESYDSVNNMISALTIVSLATTEEEYRHILQYKFWKILSCVMEDLSVSVEFTRCDDLVRALRQQRVSL